MSAEAAHAKALELEAGGTQPLAVYACPFCRVNHADSETVMNCRIESMRRAWGRWGYEVPIGITLLNDRL